MYMYINTYKYMYMYMYLELSLIFPVLAILCGGILLNSSTELWTSSLTSNSSGNFDKKPWIELISQSCSNTSDLRLLINY